MGGFEPTTICFESNNTNYCATEAAHLLLFLFRDTPERRKKKEKNHPLLPKNLATPMAQPASQPDVTDATFVNLSLNALVRPSLLLSLTQHFFGSLIPAASDLFNTSRRLELHLSTGKDESKHNRQFIWLSIYDCTFKLDVRHCWVIHIKVPFLQLYFIVIFVKKRQLERSSTLTELGKPITH